MNKSFTTSVWPYVSEDILLVTVILLKILCRLLLVRKVFLINYQNNNAQNSQTINKCRYILRAHPPSQFQIFYTHYTYPPLISYAINQLIIAKFSSWLNVFYKIDDCGRGKE